MHTPRDLSTTVASTTYHVDSHERGARSAIRKAQDAPDDPHQYGLISVPSDMARGLLQRYARGDSLEAMRQFFRDDYVPTLQRAAALSLTFFPEHRLLLHFEQRASWMLLFALVCFDEDGSMMAHLGDWFTPDCKPVLYAMLRKGLVRDFVYDAEYDRQSDALPYEDKIVGILLQGPQTWERALGALMKQWPKLTQRYGYREQADDTRHAFGLFPLHVGLAVCAFDIDDSAFRHCPYYPGDLVDYYRAHRRHTRDAWRTGVIDPRIGFPQCARAQPRKTYALTKADAYQRWLELVCGEHSALIELARKALGKRKTMPSLDVVMQALAATGLALHADFKDDETVEAQAAALCQSWQLPALAIRAMDQQGPARIDVILETLQALDTQQQQRLAIVDCDDGNVNAILYGYHHEAEFITLCEQLAVPLATTDS